VTPLTLLYRDPYLVAVDKPHGLLVHRSSMAAEVHDAYAVQLLRDQIGQKVYPVHRLDRPTSGVLLFALDPSTARQLGDAFTRHELHKRYLAVVRGYTDDEGVIDYPLVGENGGEARPAVSRYRTLGRVELPIPVGRYPCARYSLVAVEPLTGRWRQIRRHFHHIFHPLVGDTSHGEGRHNRLFRDHFDSQRLLLFATDLKLRHPVSGEPLHLHAPLDVSTQALFARFGWQGLG